MLRTSTSIFPEVGERDMTHVVCTLTKEKGKYMPYFK